LTEAGIARHAGQGAVGLSLGLVSELVLLSLRRQDRLGVQRLDGVHGEHARGDPLVGQHVRGAEDFSTGRTKDFAAVGGFSGWLGTPPDSAFPADMLSKLLTAFCHCRLSKAACPSR